MTSDPALSGPDAVADKLRRQRVVLARFGLLAFRSDDLDELLGEAARQIAEALEVDFVKILESRPERGELLVRAGVNWGPGVVGRATLGADDGSPAGHALLHRQPVVSPDLERETRFRVPQLLAEHGVRSMVNVIVEGDHGPFGVLEVDAREPRSFDDDEIAFLRNYANLIAAAVDRLRTHAALSRTAAEKQALAEELKHRVKNLLALVQAIASQTTAEDRSGEDFRAAFLGRLGALAASQAMLFDDEGLQGELAALVERTLEPHRADRPEAVEVAGPPVALPSKRAVTLGLVLYELATNAAKHGALSVPEGRVRVAWDLEETTGHGTLVRLIWEERGGPPVAPPRRRSFGRRMIERAFAEMPGGGTTLRFEPEGLRCEITLPAGVEGRDRQERR